MKKVLVLVGSYRKGTTYEAACEFEQMLTAHADIECKIVFLKDYTLEFCRGCKNCFLKGEQFCPLRDDRDLLIGMMEASDGVVLAVPNYSFQVPAQVKNLLDRLAFMLHRPHFFGNAFIPIVTQGIYGGRSIIKYLLGVGQNLGFYTAKGCVLATLEPMTQQKRCSNTKKLQKAAKRYQALLLRTIPKRPSLFRLMMFRMSRSSMKVMLNDEYYDFRHFRDHGWFESDYYCNVSLGPVKRAMGKLFDLLGKRIAKQA